MAGRTVTIPPAREAAGIPAFRVANTSFRITQITDCRYNTALTEGRTNTNNNHTYMPQHARTHKHKPPPPSTTQKNETAPRPAPLNLCVDRTRPDQSKPTQRGDSRPHPPRPPRLRICLVCVTHPHGAQAPSARHELRPQHKVTTHGNTWIDQDAARTKSCMSLGCVLQHKHGDAKHVPPACAHGRVQLSSP